MNTGTPIAYTPHPEHEHLGTDPLPGFLRKAHPDGTGDIMFWPGNRSEPVQFDGVPQGDGPHTWCPAGKAGA
jgi:hypothetical protein